MAAFGRRKAADVPEEDWFKAYKRVDDGETVSEVARQLSLDRVTLWRRYKDRKAGVSRRGPKPTFGLRGEAELVKWLQMHERIGKCVSVKLFSTFAARIALELGIDDFKAGRDWHDRFFARHPELAKRTGEKTEHKRMYAVNPFAINEYYEKVAPLVKDRAPSKIWNMDEWVFDLMNISNGLVGARVLSALHTHVVPLA